MKTILFLVAGFLALSAVGEQTVRADGPSPDTFTSLQSVADLATDGAEIQTAGKWNPVGIDRANQGIQPNAVNRPATFHLKIENFEPYHKDGFAYRMKAPDATVAIHGSDVRCRVWIYFKEDQSDILARVHKGATLTFSGTLGRADLQMIKGKPILSLDLQDAHIADNEVL